MNAKLHTHESRSSHVAHNAIEHACDGLASQVAPGGNKKMRNHTLTTCIYSVNYANREGRGRYGGAHIFICDTNTININEAVRGEAESGFAVERRQMRASQFALISIDAPASRLLDSNKCFERN